MIEFSNVGLRYGNGPEILRDLTFSVEPGSFHFLTGPSGSGKTSLLRLLLLSLKPSRGRVSMFGEDVSNLSQDRLLQMRRHIGIVFQGGLAEVKFDCAAGTIDDPVPARDGPFMAKGSYRAGANGPVRVGQIFRSQRAVYSGEMAKNVMTLSVQLEDDDTTIGPFTLTENQPPQITRCL